MTKENLNLAETYQSISNAEKQALLLEKMLDDIDGKMDSILEEMKGTLENTESDKKLRNVTELDRK